jgi:AraC-like DNA-binding protein
MRIGATLPRGTYGLLEFCIRHSGTVREGLWKLASYRALAGDVSAMRVEVCDAGARLVEHFPGDPLGPGRQVNEFTLALYVCTIREVIGEPSWAPQDVYFMHTQPRNLAPLVELLGTRRLSFRQSGNGMLVSNAVLDRSLVGADAQLLGVLEEQVKKELVQQALVIDIQSALHTRVCEHLPRGNPKLETVASELRMSGRSLQRWLQERGLTFNHVVEEARRQLALAYLREPERTLGDIASSLGFSDLRAFSRAFRRWTSEPPGAWRKRHLTSSDLSCVSSVAPLHVSASGCSGVASPSLHANGISGWKR